MTALALGANDYVTKPLDFPVVLARVRTHLALKRAAEQVQQLERSLAERNRELEQTNAQLEKINGRMSHDLKAAAKIQEDLPAPRGNPRCGPGLRLDLPALRRTGRRRPERHTARRKAGWALHSGRQRPRCRVGPAFRNAEPCPVTPAGAVLDPGPGWQRPGSARYHTAR